MTDQPAAGSRDVEVWVQCSTCAAVNLIAIIDTGSWWGKGRTPEQSIKQAPYCWTCDAQTVALCPKPDEKASEA